MIRNHRSHFSEKVHVWTQVLDSGTCGYPSSSQALSLGGLQQEGICQRSINLHQLQLRLGQNFRKASPPAVKHREEGVLRILGCHGKSKLDFVALKSPSGHSTFIAIVYT